MLGLVGISHPQQTKQTSAVPASDLRQRERERERESKDTRQPEGEKREGELINKHREEVQ